MKLTPVGIDIAKNVMQVHYVDEETGEVVNKPIKRAQFLEYFANRAPCLIGMEACGGAHHWARQLTKMGHQVKLMPAEFVKAFNIRNKNDAADARAIWLAVQQPSKPVAVKTEMQQARFCRSKAGWTSKRDCYVLLMKRASRTAARRTVGFCQSPSSALS